MNMIRSHSPPHPDDLVVEVPEATPAEVATAAARARQAQPAWAAAPAATRAAALGSIADDVAAAAGELTDLVVREVGKPRAEAAGEVARTVAILRYYAQQVYDPIGSVHAPGSGAAMAFTRRRARGVAGLVTPWNFPLAIPIWKAAPALAFGNAVLLKPAPQATGAAQRLGDLIARHVPEGLFTVLPGDVAAGTAVIDTADVVSFTGSAEVGAQVAVAAARRGVPVQCEMGGQNPAIVLPDANLGNAATHIAAAAFGFAGQKCTATKRIIVVGPAAEFTDAFIAAAEQMAVGDPADMATTIGPVIEQRAQDAVTGAADGARVAGGRLLTGGTARNGDGWFVDPTVVDGLPGGHPLLTEEVFGPICAIVAADSEAEAVSIANDVRFGLTAAVYTGGLDSALRVTDSLHAGQIKVNAPTTGVDFHLPFGGENRSSFGGREQGKAAMDFYTSLHTVTVAPRGGS
jgi:acyl-CoA reductase-like NAD-dependent aldehyde dehydrogenase